MTDPHQYVERFEQQLQDAQRKADAIQGAFRESRAEARSPDGAVVVAVASGGRIESLQLTPKAMDLGHTTLGRTIMDTIRRAQVEAARKIEESVRPLLGDGESMRYLRDQVEQGIAVIDPGAPPPEQPTAKHPVNRPANRDDDDFEGGTFLR